MNWTSNHIGHWGRECPPLLQWKHMRPVASLGLGGADPPTNVVGTQGGPGMFKVGGVKCKGVGKCLMHGIGLRNTLEAFEGVGGGGAICEDFQNASLVIQCLLYSVAAAYHWCGESSEGRPSVRQATWSWIIRWSPW
jgi:hypothetical protein